MSFSLAGTTITQTGTDTDLSGLSGISGVTVLGGVYYIANREILVNGTLSIDPETEMLWFDTNSGPVELEVRGTLNVGTEATQNGVTYYSEAGVWLHTERQGTSNSNFATASLRNAAGGTINWYGGIARTKALLSHAAGCITNIKNAQWQMNATSPMQYRFQVTSGTPSEVNIENFIMTASISYARLFFTQPPESFSGDFRRATFQMQKTQQGQVDFTNMRFEDNRNTFSLELNWDGTGSPNMHTVTNFNGNPVVQKVTTNRLGVYEFYSDVAHKVTQGGVAVEDAIVYFVDEDNSSRQNPVGTGWTQNYTDDREYVDSTDSNGDVSFTPLIRVSQSLNQVSSTVVEDNRTQSNDTDYVFDSYIWAYGSLPATSTLTGIGLNTKTTSVPVVADPSITESSQTTVEAYTSIDNLDELYDRIKAYKCNTANVTYPTAGTAIATASGDAIDLGNRNLVIDATAASAFAVNTGTDTITIKSSDLIAGTKFARLTTTGSITTANGATISVPFTDSSGTNVTLSITAVDSAGSPVSGARAYLKISGGADLLNTTTNASGIATASYTHTGDVSVTGWVRSGSASPYYKQASVSGTVTTAGFDVTATLVEDE